MDSNKSWIAFMASVLVHDDLPFLEDRSLNQIYDGCPNYWPDAPIHMGLIAQEHGCRYAIAYTARTRGRLRYRRYIKGQD